MIRSRMPWSVGCANNSISKRWQHIKPALAPEGSSSLMVFLGSKGKQHIKTGKSFFRQLSLSNTLRSGQKYKRKIRKLQQRWHNAKIWCPVGSYTYKLITQDRKCQYAHTSIPDVTVIPILNFSYRPILIENPLASYKAKLFVAVGCTHNKVVIFSSVTLYYDDTYILS